MTAVLTALFLGQPAGWARARLELASLHPLWGGHTVCVEGAGATRIRLVERGLSYERAFQLQLGVEPAHALLRLCVEHDLLAIDPPERAFLIPDESATELRLSCGRRSFRVLCWDHDPPGPAFNAISRALLELRGLTRDAAPVYQGPYRPEV